MPAENPMDCQCCNRKKATVRICDLEDNSIAEQHNVCADCFALVKRYLFDMARPLAATADIVREVQSMLNADQTALALPETPGALAPLASNVPVCPECGMTLADFKARGRFGCPRDYEVFAEHLDPLFERIHDVQPPRHKGRTPEALEGRDVIVARTRQLAQMRERLEAAVREENFELAARLRDEINELQGKDITRA
jgi:protein arginine kinase activator